MSYVVQNDTAQPIWHLQCNLLVMVVLYPNTVLVTTPNQNLT